MSKVEIKTSVVHGNGVFATQTIKKGERITQYPADLHVVQKGEIHELHGATKEYIKDVTDRLSVGEIMKYSKQLLGGTFIFGDPKKFKPDACAHIINDAVKTDKINLSPVNEDIGHEAVNYYLQSMRFNCALVSGKTDCWAIAAKDINPGDEIFTSYDYSYWVDVDSDTLQKSISNYMMSLTDGKRKWICRLLEEFDI